VADNVPVSRQDLSTTMSKFPFPWIALGVGLLLTLLLLSGGDKPLLPLLTRLIVAEFGFVLNVIGAVMGARDLARGGLRYGLLVATIGCALLAVGLAMLGIHLWTGMAQA
jgi:hypothetical protein